MASAGQPRTPVDPSLLAAVEAVRSSQETARQTAKTAARNHAQAADAQLRLEIESMAGACLRYIAGDELAVHLALVDLSDQRPGPDRFSMRLIDNTGTDLDTIVFPDHVGGRWRVESTGKLLWKSEFADHLSKVISQRPVASAAPSPAVAPIPQPVSSPLIDQTVGAVEEGVGRRTSSRLRDRMPDRTKAASKQLDADEPRRESIRVQRYIPKKSSTGDDREDSSA